MIPAILIILGSLLAFAALVVTLGGCLLHLAVMAAVALSQVVAREMTDYRWQAPPMPGTPRSEVVPCGEPGGDGKEVT